MNPTLRRLFLGGSGSTGGGGFVEPSFGPGIVLGDSTTARVPTVTSFLRNPAQSLITDLAVPGEKTNGQIARFDALSSGVKAAAKWIIVMTGLNDRTDFPDGPTEVANYQVAINHLRTVCPTAKILIAKMNPAFSFYDLLLGNEGATAVAKYKAQWIAMNDAIGGSGPTPITGADFRVVRQTGYLMDPSYPNSLNPLLAENPGDLHQNIIGSQIIALAWQNGLDQVFSGNAIGLGSLHSYVVGKISYYDGNYPFIDKMKTGAGFNFATGCTKNAAGWITVMPAGVSAASLIVTTAPWFPPGDYAITSTSAATIGLSGTGFTNFVGGVHRATFTVPDQTEDWFRTNFSMTASATNNTGSPISVTDFKIFRLQDEYLINAGGDGAVFAPEYLALLQGAKVIRFLEWMGINQVGFTPDGMWKFSDFGVQTLDKPSYCHFEGMCGACIPAMLLLCRLIGARPFFSMGLGANQAPMNYTHTDNLMRTCAWYDHSQPGTNRFVDGVQVRLASPTDPTTCLITPVTRTYFVRDANVYPGTFRLALTLGGAAVQVANTDLHHDAGDFNFAYWNQADGIDEYTDMFLPFAQSVFSLDPNCHPLLEYANECWNFGYGVWALLHYHICSFRLNTSLQSLGYMWQNLKLYKAFEAVFPPANVGRVIAWATQPIDFDFQILSTAFTSLDPGVYDPTKTIQQILLTAPSRCYFAVAPYIEPQKADGSWHNAASIYADLGNRLPTNADWDNYFNDSISKWIVGTYFPWSQIVASKDTWLPGAKICTYEWGQQAFWSQGGDPKWTQVEQSLSDYLESAAGAAMYERAWQALFAPYTFDFVNFYNSEGSRVIVPTAFSHWGITDRYLDNPSSIWFRSK